MPYLASATRMSGLQGGQVAAECEAAVQIGDGAVDGEGAVEGGAEGLAEGEGDGAGIGVGEGSGIAEAEGEASGEGEAGGVGAGMYLSSSQQAVSEASLQARMLYFPTVAIPRAVQTAIARAMREFFFVTAHTPSFPRGTRTPARFRHGPIATTDAQRPYRE